MTLSTSPPKVLERRRAEVKPTATTPAASLPRRRHRRLFSGARPASSWYVYGVATAGVSSAAVPATECIKWRDAAASIGACV